MSKDIRDYIQRLCEQHRVAIPKKRLDLFHEFADHPGTIQACQTIQTLQQTILSNWKEQNAIADIQDKRLAIPNARVGKPYTLAFDPAALGLDGIAAFELAIPEATGMAYDPEARELSCTPTEAGEYRLKLLFRHQLSAEDSPFQEKEIPLIVNADPKSLWKDLPSDHDDPYWKEDTDLRMMPLAGCTLVAASKRGRSHAHEGKFRDDDFRAAEVAGGWGIVALADGAGSAKYSRRGSLVACESVVRFFQDSITGEQWQALESAIVSNNADSTEGTQKALSQHVLEHLSKAAYTAHNVLAQEATASEATLKDYGTTLMFALLKQFDFGWFIASFWVGDGGLGIYRQEAGEVMVLGAPDGGEFAGQTRFLTMPDIFKSPDFYKRFSIRTVPDFTALVLMTDGITDPKFGTDANLGRVEKWNDLWSDLGGQNEDNAKVTFVASNENAAAEMLAWLDFWSPGNHDDRTIAVIF